MITKHLSSTQCRSNAKIIIYFLFFCLQFFQVNVVTAGSVTVPIDEWPVYSKGLGLLPTNGQLWKTDAIISVYFENLYSEEIINSDPDVHTVRYYPTPNHAIWEAFQLWEEATALDFEKVNGPDNADIVIRWGSHYELPNFKEKDRGKSILARTFQSGRANNAKADPTIIHFVDSFNWFVGQPVDEVANIKSDETSVTVVALHEIGHAIGLGHSSTDKAETDSDKLNSIMYYSINTGSSNSITKQDIIDTHKLYNTDVSLIDIDHDDVPVINDNCACLEIWCDGGLWFIGSPTANTAQTDSNGNGIGDICDTNSAPLTVSFLGLTSQPVVTNLNSKKVFGLYATDPDDDVLTYTLEMDVEHGTVLVSSLGKVQYVPDFDYEGQDSFQYRVEDPAGLFAIGEISLLVVRPKRSMIINKVGTGSGHVVSNPEDIDCGANCFPEIAQGDTVILDASPDEGSIFIGWDGDCSSSGISNTCTVTMDGTKIIIARFEKAPAVFHLSVKKTGTGTGNINSNSGEIDCGSECNAAYVNGDNVYVTLQANPDAGSVFLGWNGACSGKDDCILTMYNDKDITASFAIGSPTTYVVSNLNDNGAGSLRQQIEQANLNPGDDVISFAEGLKGTIALSSGQLSITDSVEIVGPGANKLTISGNHVSRIFNIDPGTIGTVTIQGIAIKQGSVTSGNGGAGIIINSGTVSIDQVLLADNVASGGGGGGGIRKFGPGPLTVSNSTFTKNTALDEFSQGDGGGIRIDQGNGKLTINNSTFSGNVAANGGGVTLDEGLLVIANSTITDNSAVNGGAGIHSGFSSELILSNSIVAGNTAPLDKEIEDFGLFESLGHNVLGENGVAGITDNSKLAGTDIVPPAAINAVIAALADNGGTTPTHLPVENGLAIDAGSNALITGSIITDQRGAGFYRVNNALVDIGAVETPPSTYRLTVEIVGNAGTVSSVPEGINCLGQCTAVFDADALITLNATAADGAIFTGWSGACSGMQSCVISMTEQRSVMANFEVTRASQVDCLFDWAEKDYASLLSPSGVLTASWEIYSYRYYALTDAYVGVSSADDNVYYMGANRVLQNVGPLSTWLPVAGCFSEP